MFKFPATLILFAFFSGCAPSQVKIKSTPRKIGYQFQDKIVVTPVAGLDDRVNDKLMRWASQTVAKKIPRIGIVNYWIQSVDVGL